ncbi:MAG TPA: HEAT repeat domain-containing protein [Longimicrobiales bacterium]|nr:HEAT repeat domain-containing protein [Longimicrobiales bacterium]
MTEWSLSDWRLATLVALIALLWLVAVGFSVSALLLRLRNIKKAEFWRRLEDKWEAALPGVLAGTSPVEGMAKLVEPGEELYFVDFLYRHGRTMTRGQRAVLAKLAEPNLPVIAARMAKGDSERRARAVQTVAVLGFERHWQEIVAALDDESPLVVMTAARSLAREDGARFGGEVISRLHRFDDWSPKFLTSMLVSMGPGGAPVLRQSLANPVLLPRLRAVCAEALGQMRDLGSADTAAQVARSEADPDVLAACLRLLRRVGGRHHLPVIRQLGMSPDEGVRAQAIGALGRLGAAEDLERLREALSDTSPWVVIQAARGLRDRGEADWLWKLAAGTDPGSEAALQVLGE